LYSAACLLACVLSAANAPANLRGLLAEPANCPAVDYLIICPAKAAAVVAPLAKLHQHAGLSCRIVTADAISAWAGKADVAAITKFCGDSRVRS